MNLKLKQKNALDYLKVKFYLKKRYNKEHPEQRENEIDEKKNVKSIHEID